MAEAAGERPKRPPLGLTANRVRGLLALLFLLGLVYFTIFESEPPPQFTEVVIEIPPPPEEVDFGENTIMLPEFKPSPLKEGQEESSQVEIIPVVEQKASAPEPEPVTVEEEEEGEQPEEVAEPEPEPEVSESVALLSAEIREEPAEEEPKVKVEPAEPTSAPPAGFHVQVAALSSRDKADEMSGRLDGLLGEPTYVLEVERQGQLLYRVRLGPFGEDEGKANEVLNRLRELEPDLGRNAFVDAE